ncbi:MAG: mechanosensitive ion channel family protein [Fidelibacterota bacterium]
MEFLNIIKPYLIPLCIVLAGFLSAWIFNKIIFRKLNLITQKTRWSGDDVLLRILKKYFTLWLVLGSVYLAMETGVFPTEFTIPANNVILIIFVLSLATATSSIVGSLISGYTRRYDNQFFNLGILMIIVRGLIIGIAILILLQTFGMKISPLLGALGVGSMAAGFALKDTLANFFAGIQILISKQIQVGNFVQIGSGLEGTVADITLRNTTLIDRSNNTIVVPNSEMAASTIVNYSIPDTNLRVKVDCGVAYDSDLEKVEKIALETAKHILATVDGAVHDFEPNLRFHTFNESSIDFTVIMRAIDFPSQHTVRSEYIKLLKKRFDGNGIVIPFPIRTIYQGD